MIILLKKEQRLKIIFKFKINFCLKSYERTISIIETVMTRYEDKKIIKFINIQFYLFIEIQKDSYKTLSKNLIYNISKIKSLIY